MAGKHPEGVRSTVAVAGHPIHPMLVPFPIAFLVGAFATDLAFWGTSDPFWARVSLWLIGAGLLMGLLAAAVGLIEFVTIARAREHMAGWIHFLGNALVLVLALANLFLRLDDPVAGMLPSGVMLSGVTAALLGVTGWYGGELAYRHKIGVAGHDDRDLHAPDGE